MLQRDRHKHLFSQQHLVNVALKPPFRARYLTRHHRWNDREIAVFIDSMHQIDAPERYITTYYWPLAATNAAARWTDAMHSVPEPDPQSGHQDLPDRRVPALRVRQSL